MFERFTPRARRVIVLAQDVAREMGHQRIKPEHLLVALREGEGVAANAMAQSGVDGTALRQKVAARFESKASARQMNKIPFSPEAKKALEQSLRSALKLGHNYIGTEHLFFGAETEAEQRGQALGELLGVSPNDVHERIMQMIVGAGPAMMRSPALQTAMSAAARQADRARMTTGHLLAAIVSDPDSQAARALAVLGVSGDAVTSALLQVPLADTTDAASSAQSVSITVGETTTLISDPRVVATLQRLNADELRDIIKRAIGPDVPDEAAG
jgi:ATP-dependent Clp protease ATP-binding subunit ClpA